MNEKYKLALILLLSTMTMAPGLEYCLNAGSILIGNSGSDDTGYSINEPTVVPFAAYNNKKESGKKYESVRTSKSLNYDNIFQTENKNLDGLSILLNGSGTKHATTINPDVKPESIELFSSSAAPSDGLLAFRGSSGSILNESSESRTATSIGTLASRLSAPWSEAGPLNNEAGRALIDPSADPDADPISIGSGLLFLILLCVVYGVLKSRKEEKKEWRYKLIKRKCNAFISIYDVNAGQ